MVKPSNIRSLFRRVRGWDDAGAVFANSGWLVGENFLRMGLALVISAAMARGLGAEDLGTLRATLAFVTLCSSFTNFGLYGIVVKALAQHPEEAHDTLGTTSLLYVIGSFVSAALCVSVATSMYDDVGKLLLALIFTVGVLFHAPNVATLWFQYKVRSKYAVYAKSIPSIASGIGIIAAAIFGAPVEVFAIIIVADTVLGALALTALSARAKDIPKNLTARFDTARRLLAQSWPLVASTVAVKIYLKIDQLMIERMVDDAAVGVYSVAADISEIWYILPAALATSVLSGIVILHTRDEEAYRERIQDLLDLLVMAAIVIVITVALLAAPVMDTVYGAEFDGSAAILRIHILAAPFIFMGKILSKTIITEGYFKFSLVRHVVGAAVNVGLNLCLIPRYGGIGAAWATVVSYAAANYFAAALHPKARVMFVQMSRALALPFR